ncbi:MAG: Crp/Fnr family transcriptional regulator, partial [Deltaproteobacteria bacterium]|nr:Crp/Fnr family transcriptional regulator [Deltaproteobacteria bacterium]
MARRPRAQAPAASAPIPSDAAAIARALADNPVLAHAGTRTIEVLAAHSEARAWQRGERLLDEGAASDACFALVRGTVGVFYSSTDGVAVLVKIFGAPAIFGEMELLWGLPRLEYVEAFTPVVAVRIRGDELHQALRSEGALAYAMLRDVARRLCIAAYHERALAFQTVPMRLAGVLLSFAAAHGTRCDDGVLIDVPLTYEMLARCLGATTRSVDRAFAT